MVLVDHRRALGQLAEIADEPLGIARGAAPAACLGGVLGEELGLADDGDAPVLDADAALQRRHREADLRVAREKGGEIDEQHEGDRVLPEQLREGLAPAQEGPQTRAMRRV